MTPVEQHSVGHYYIVHHSCHRSGYCEEVAIARIEHGILEGDQVLALHKGERRGHGPQDFVGRGCQSEVADSPCEHSASLAESHRDLALSA
jgi:hypothetical protein